MADACRVPIVEYVHQCMRDHKPVFFAAPMVRYSKLPYRMLLRKWGCDVVATPMITADTFVRSQLSRDVELETCKGDAPLVVQFGACNASDLGMAAELVAHCADVVDINCGCPQKWAIQEGIGAALLRDPELVKEMVKTATTRSGLPVSVKIRIDKDLRKTVDYVRAVEQAGPCWITVHGRLVGQKSSSPPNLAAIKLVKEVCSLPVIGNGDVFTRDQALEMVDYCKVDGVMAARGLLSNPSLFQGTDVTPAECIVDYINLAIELGSPFQTLHHTLAMMIWGQLSKFERIEFIALRSVPAILNFLEAAQLI